MRAERKAYTTHLEDETARKIKAYAREDFRSFSGMIRWILKQYIAEREKGT